MKVHLNGSIVPVEDAKVSVFDRGFLYGDAIFETLAVYDRNIFRFRQHWDRLVRSAAAIGLVVPLDEKTLRDRLDCLLVANHLRDAILRVCITRGVGTRGLGTVACRDPAVVIHCFPPRTPSALRRPGGARLVVARLRRIPASAFPPEAKTANYLAAIVAYNEAITAGADEAVLLTIDGFVAEGTVSNIFMVLAGQLYTPCLDSGVLPGITRACVLEIARNSDLALKEEFIPAELLERTDEVFYTNTTGGVIPVGQIAGRTISCVGPITSLVRERYRDLVRQEAGQPWPE